MRLLPWDYGVRNLARRPLRTALTALGLTLVVFLLLLVVGFVRGLELSLQQSGDPEVVVLHNANAAENLDTSSISGEVPTLARTEFSPHLVRYGDMAAVSPELTIASRVGTAEGGPGQLGVLRGVDWDRVFLVRRQAFLLEGKLPRRDEILVGRLVPGQLRLPAAHGPVGRTRLVARPPC